MTRTADQLRSIKNFDQLIPFLEEDLEWPFPHGRAQYDFEDLTFQYSAEEVGLEAEYAAKIKSIHQLRPLVGGQPWGIFFVEFENKKLPIVVLRRILNHLVLKKRASANPAERARWNTGDLIFISAFAEEGTQHREIAFAHFHQDPGDQPTLRVLGWDGGDTPLKLEHVAQILKQRLRWPADPANHELWRKQWSGAFRYRIGQQIQTADLLAKELARVARNIRDAAMALMRVESARGPLRTIHEAFRIALIHDLDQSGFADTYAQTITYGLLTAAISRTDRSAGADGTFVLAEDLHNMVPITNPFLKEMLESFLKVGGRGTARHNGLDFDELGVQEVVELLRSSEIDLPAVLEDFGNRNPGEDPVIRFYEDFLKAYNWELKIKRGVFYTPQPVVSYIVRSVHELLQADFGVEDGLASTVTWGEMAAKHAGLTIPAGSKSNDPFVVVLDPATGTATFLVEVIDVIYKTLTAKWKVQGLTEARRHIAWNDYVPKHLLPRLHGYELLMAPYAIAHMKIGLKLYETGYAFGTDERARVYLTNALEPADDESKQMTFAELMPALAHEAQAVNSVKRNQHFTVVLGNPPYSNYGQLNKNPWILGLLDDYKKGLREKKLNLDDDFIKFLRFSQLCIDRSGAGLLGFITNHTYLDGVTHRRLRQSMLESFHSLNLLDLHGSVKKAERCPDGSPDKNVFDIQQGVAIGIFLKLPRNPIPKTLHSSLWGTREEKYHYLSDQSISVTSWESIAPTEDRFYFVPHNLVANSGYGNFVSIREAFVEAATGFETARDHFAITFTREELRGRLQDLIGPESDNVIRERWGLDDKRDWTLPNARARLRQLQDPLSDLRTCCYRPLDYRFTHYNDIVVTWPRIKVLGRIDKTNPAIVAARMVKGESPNHFFVVNQPAEKIFISGKTSNNAFIFPLYQKEDHQVVLPDGSGRPSPKRGLALNIREELIDRFLSDLELADKDLDIDSFAWEVFHYIYAVFHSAEYRSTYAEFLKTDFPRFPLTKNLELFRQLAILGAETVSIHLLEAPTLGSALVTYSGPQNPQVDKITYADDVVWLDRAQTIGFKGVAEPVWNFHVGGYQVCEKWLKDRRGRMLSNDDVAHYKTIVAAMDETIRLMKRVDEVIDEHGGWPDAFATSSE